MKGNFKNGLKVFKMSSKKLNNLAQSSFVNTENKKIPLNCEMEIKLGAPIKMSVSTYTDENSFYNNIHFDIISDIIPEYALNTPISEERIRSQITKTTNTPYEFKKLSIHLDDNIYIPHIADINKLRRDCLSKLENIIIEKYCSKTAKFDYPTCNIKQNTDSNNLISILLNRLELTEDYSLLKDIDRIYIPLKYFFNSIYKDTLENLGKKFDLYIYLPIIMRNNYKKMLSSNIENILNSYNVKGFVLSNLGNLEMIKNYINNYDLIGNYTLNVFNNITAQELNNLGINTIALSPELNEDDFRNFTNSVQTELILYSNTTIMTMNYCLLGKSNKCYKDCKHYCLKNDNKFYLIDRLGFKFEIIPDSIEGITSIFNSKILSIMPSNLHNSSIRLDFLHENVNEINEIVSSIKNKTKLEGSNFTNGNWFREV